MTKAPPRDLLILVLLAVGLHALLFVAVRPGKLVAGRAAGKAPATVYMSKRAGLEALAGVDVRVVNSPVLFSLPSGMGFSRELKGNDVATRLNTFSRPEQSARFFEADPVSVLPQEKFESGQFMVSPVTTPVPRPPSSSFVAERKRPSARRVSIAPELKERLIGGVVLPAELNQPTSRAWEAKASVRVSEEGVVEYVFFEEPLESSLNIQVQRLLRSLSFGTGDAVEGRIEIYSPEPSGQTEAVP